MVLMMSGKALRLALLFLLGFTVFCLVVVELILTKSSPSLRRMLHPLIERTCLAAESPLVRQRQDPPDVRRNSSSIHRSLSGISQDSTDVHPNSFKVFRNSQNSWSANQHGSAAVRPSLSGIVDHCEGARQATRASSPLNLKAQTAENGTRPVSCRGCFHTDFPPLLENCGVCNTGAGGRSDRVDVLLAVLTTHKAVDRRQAIRDTWASVTRHNTAHVRHVFLLGRVQVSSPHLCIFKL